jgi:hypothetical protein
VLGFTPTLGQSRVATNLNGLDKPVWKSFSIAMDNAKRKSVTKLFTNRKTTKDGRI